MNPINLFNFHARIYKKLDSLTCSSPDLKERVNRLKQAIFCPESTQSLKKWSIDALTASEGFPELHALLSKEKTLLDILDWIEQGAPEEGGKILEALRLLTPADFKESPAKDFITLLSKKPNTENHIKACLESLPQLSLTDERFLLNALSWIKDHENNPLLQWLQQKYGLTQKMILDLEEVDLLIKDTSVVVEKGIFSYQTSLVKAMETLQKWEALGFSYSLENSETLLTQHDIINEIFEKADEWLAQLTSRPLTFSTCEPSLLIAALNKALEENDRDALDKLIYFFLDQDFTELAPRAVFNFVLDKYPVLHPDTQLLDKSYESGTVAINGAFLVEALNRADLKCIDLPIEKTARIAKKMEKLRQAFALCAAWSKLLCFYKEGVIDSIIGEIAEMEFEEFIFIPYGSKGHATLLGIEKTGESHCSLTLYNTGDGIEEHPSKEGKYQTFISYENVPIAPLLKQEVWDSFFSLWNKKSEGGWQWGQSAKEMNLNFARIAEGGCKMEPSHAAADYKNPQQQGSCAAQCEMAALRHHLMKGIFKNDLDRMGIL